MQQGGLHLSTEAVITDNVAMSARPTISTGAAANGMTHHTTANPGIAPVIASVPTCITVPADTLHLTGRDNSASAMLIGMISLAGTTNLIAIATPADIMTPADTVTLTGIVIPVHISPADMKDVTVQINITAQIGMQI